MFKLICVRVRCKQSNQTWPLFCQHLVDIFFYISSISALSTRVSEQTNLAIILPIFCWYFVDIWLIFCWYFFNILIDIWALSKRSSVQTSVGANKLGKLGQYFVDIFYIWFIFCQQFVDIWELLSKRVSEANKLGKLGQ